MGTTSITITNEAYNYLKNIKGERSFSETIIGLSRNGEDIIKFAGMFKETDLKGMENVRKRINSDWNNRR